MKYCFFKSLCLSVLLPVSALFAQDGQIVVRHNLKLAFEFGANAMRTELAKPEQIRKNYSISDNNNYVSWKNHHWLNTTYFGIKPEFFVFNNRVGIASGLRFTMASSELTADRNDFMWKLKEDEVDLITDYVQIRDIHHKSYLLGVPFEVRIFPNNREKPVQNYFKLGASLNYRISSEYDVDFSDKTMEKHTNLINNQLDEYYHTFNAFFFGAFGLKFGKFKEGSWTPWVNVEFQFPYILLTEKSLAFAGKGSFPCVGIQMSFQIPVGKNMPIGSN